MRWLRLLGYIVAFLGTIWTSGKAILDWLGRFDFVIAHRPDLGWIGGAVDYLAAPPWWLPWCVLSLGLAIVWLEVRWRTSRIVNAAIEPSVNLTLQCDLADLPNRCPPEGRIGSMRLFYSPDSGVDEPIGLIIKHCQPGSRIGWFADLKFPQVFRCEVTNYGQAPLLQVGLKFQIEYKEVDTAPDGKSARVCDSIQSRDWLIIFPKIDPGKNNAVIFYVYNACRYFASVIPPTVASYISLDKVLREAPLLPIGIRADMSLWPVEYAKPS